MDDSEPFAVSSCTRCAALVESRSRIVNGSGPATADVLLVGEGPGQTEDAEGEPFVGRSGAILDEALERVGLARSAIRITNCVRCRPPDNRDPTRGELEACRDHLEAEIDAVDPAVVVTLGKVPSEHLLEREVAVTAAAGSLESIIVNGSERPVVVSVHPAASLYNGGDTAPLERALGRAVDLSGSGGQTTLEDL